MYLDFCLRSFAGVQLEQVAGLQVDSSSTVWILLQVAFKNLRADIKIV